MIYWQCVNDEDLTVHTAVRTVFEVKVTGGLSRPQSHGVDNVVSVARDRGVIWQSQHDLPIPSQEETDI